MLRRAGRRARQATRARRSASASPSTSASRSRPPGRVRGRAAEDAEREDRAAGDPGGRPRRGSRRPLERGEPGVARRGPGRDGRVGSRPHARGGVPDERRRRRRRAERRDRPPTAGGGGRGRRRPGHAARALAVLRVASPDARARRPRPRRADRTALRRREGESDVGPRRLGTGGGRGRTGVQHVVPVRPRRRARGALPEDPPVRRRPAGAAAAAGVRGVRRGERARHAPDRPRPRRPVDLLRPALPRAVPRSDDARRRDHAGARGVHARDGRGPLGGPAPRPGDRGPVLRRRAGAVGRVGAARGRPPDPRALDDRRSVGSRARRGAGRRRRCLVRRPRPGRASPGADRPAGARPPAAGSIC